MNIEKIINSLKFDGTYIFNEDGIDTYATFSEMNNKNSNIVLFNPNTKDISFRIESDNGDLYAELSNIHKFILITKMKKAYRKKFNRNLIETWCEFISLHSCN